MKKLLKTILKHPITQTVLIRIMVFYVRMVWWTSRSEMVMDSAAEPYARGEKNAIFCFWHGRLLMHSMVIPKARPMQVLISQHRDGEMIARTVEQLGMHTIRGSSSKGARAALRNMIEHLEAGNNIGITPDGPRGPFEVAAPGAAQLAKLADKPLIPVSCSVTRGKRFGSWDRFMLPWPFTRIVFHVGAPITFDAVGKGAVDEVTAQLQSTLIALGEKADNACL